MGDNKEKQKGTVQGFFGFKTDKTNSMAKQGLNVYRRGQLIENTISPYIWMVLLRTTVITFYRRNKHRNKCKYCQKQEDSDANDIALYKNSIKNMNIAVATDDRKIIDLEIAKFRKEFDLKLNTARKDIKRLRNY